MAPRGRKYAQGSTFSTLSCTESEGARGAGPVQDARKAAVDKGHDPAGLRA